MECASKFWESHQALGNRGNQNASLRRIKNIRKRSPAGTSAGPFCVFVASEFDSPKSVMDFQTPRIFENSWGLKIWQARD
ncbi:MAG: hypothetical protein B6D41_16770 [Chloroflexi bacterium UTCFX4]|nr:MAG: hypothetical protein B6D41_16770 [Chloroflexi bacterium UTCFX4]